MSMYSIERIGPPCDGSHYAPAARDDVDWVAWGKPVCPWVGGRPICASVVECLDVNHEYTQAVAAVTRLRCEGWGDRAGEVGNAV